MKIDSKTLDSILDNMIETFRNSRKEIFRISEHCYSEFEILSVQLADVKRKILELNEEGDRLKKQVDLTGNRLSEINVHFKDFSEEEIRGVYEQSYQMQMDLKMNRQLEKQLKERCEDLKARLFGLMETIDRSEQLSSQVSIVKEYLKSDLRQMGKVLKDAELKEDFVLRIIEAQEDERKRISREIHDGPAQMLANVMVRSDLIERIHRERGPEEALTEIKSLKEMVRNSFQEVRRIIFDLRPMALDDLGLIPTLKKYLFSIEQYHKGVKFNFFHSGEENRLPAKYEVTLFRLIQESVQNALKHSGAEVINVTLTIDQSNVAVSVTDNGRGFDVQSTNPQSFGIIGMKERVDLLQGKLLINSEIGKGSNILITIPVQEQMGQPI